MKEQGVVAFSFGVPAIIRSNRHIARIVAWKATGLGGAPVYTQADVNLRGLGLDVTHIEEEPGKPPPTLRIARGAVRWAKARGLVELWVAAAKPHLWRRLRDMEMAVREAGGGIVVRACGEIEQVLEDTWFCANSTQERTQSKWAWNKRERILRLMPFFVYKRVAS